VEIRKKAERAKASFNVGKAECRESKRDSLQGFWKKKQE
jgi:hypothetical protein